MATTKTYMDYSELAWAAYGIGFEQGMHKDGYTKNNKNILTDSGNEVKFTPSQAEGVLEISCQSDRILYSKGKTDERGIQF